MHRWKASNAPSPTVIAHRGARKRALENSIAAFELALESGAHGVELDVRLTRDGVPVVIHDRSLARITDHRDAREIRSLSVRQLRAAGSPDRPWVPTLREVLEWADRRNVLLNVELKSEGEDRNTLVREVQRLVRVRPSGRYLFSSFDPLMLQLLRWKLPAFPRGWLLETPRYVKWIPLICRLCAAEYVHPHHSLITRRRVELWKSVGLRVNAWTPNKAHDVLRLSRLGVCSLIVDEPLDALGTLGSGSA